jgi:hypothetical protein
MKLYNNFKNGILRRPTVLKLVYYTTMIGIKIRV